MAAQDERCLDAVLERLLIPLSIKRERDEERAVILASIVTALTEYVLSHQWQEVRGLLRELERGAGDGRGVEDEAVRELLETAYALLDERTGHAAETGSSSSSRLASDAGEAPLLPEEDAWLADELAEQEAADARLARKMADELAEQAAADTRLAQELTDEWEAQMAADARLAQELTDEWEAQMAADGRLAQELAALP